jgi:hypothetical protein
VRWYYGDVRITPAQIASVHDSKVVLEPGRLDDALRRAVEHAHDHESRRSS